MSFQAAGSTVPRGDHGRLAHLSKTQAEPRTNATAGRAFVPLARQPTAPRSGLWPRPRFCMGPGFPACRSTTPRRRTTNRCRPCGSMTEVGSLDLRARMRDRLPIGPSIATAGVGSCWNGPDSCLKPLTRSPPAPGSHPAQRISTILPSRMVTLRSIRAAISMLCVASTTVRPDALMSWARA